MSISQAIIPMINLRTKRVLGVLNIPTTLFSGHETEITTLSGTVIPIQPYFPDNVRLDTIPWYMIYVVTDLSLSQQTYSGFADYVNVSFFNPLTMFRSATALPNQLVYEAGSLIGLIGGVRKTPSNTIDPTPFLTATPNPVTGLAYNVNQAIDLVVTQIDQYHDVISCGVSSGSIPTGLHIDLLNPGLRKLRLYGTPTVTGAFTFTITFNISTGETIAVPISGTIN